MFSKQHGLRVVAVGECMVEFARRADGNWQQGFAGDTLNVACAMAALLPREKARVDYYTRLGGDPFSTEMLAFLEQSGLGTDVITRDPSRSAGLYTIATDDDGERSFAYWRGQSAARGMAADPAHLDAAFAGADLVYLSGISLAILPPDDRSRLLEAIAVSGAVLAFDPNVREALWESREVMVSVCTDAARAAQILLPAKEEVIAFGDTDAGQTIARFREAGLAEIVVTDGAEPTRLATQGGEMRCDVATPQIPVDTTGAGDSFNGGYLAARLAGLDPVAAVSVGQAVAAEVVMCRGALASPDILRRAALAAGMAI